MKPIEKIFPDIIGRVMCFFKKHSYKLVDAASHNLLKLECRNCKKCFAMEKELNVILNWDEDFEELFKFLKGEVDATQIHRCRRVLNEFFSHFRRFTC